VVIWRDEEDRWATVTQYGVSHRLGDADLMHRPVRSDIDHEHAPDASMKHMQIGEFQLEANNAREQAESKAPERL